MTDEVVYAAGAVCWRMADGEPRVLVIHRPRYDDITLPKGKVDPGETLPETAVREIREETGLSVALGAPLAETRYRLANGRVKSVNYWAAEIGESTFKKHSFTANDEVDSVMWLPLPAARSALSYEHDTEVLDAFERVLERASGSTFGLIVLRHAKATARSDWGGRDAARPLHARGVAQARRAVATLGAWRPRRILTSPAARCASTVAPLAKALDRKPRLEPGISQDAWEDGLATIAQVVEARIGSGKTAVLCSHRPVIPDILREIAYAAGTPMGDDIRDASVLDTAAFTVVHLSAANPASGIIALETHRPVD